MGIFGLTSFLSKHYLSVVEHEQRLHSCRLVVDGNSLMYKVHRLNALHSTHGGNYDQFAAEFDRVLEAFEQCSIEAVFVFDGARDKSDRKWQTTLSRVHKGIDDLCSLNSEAATASLDKIDLIQLIQSGRHRVFSNLLPPLCKSIVFNLLARRGVAHMHADYEADYELVCLANKLDAALLSCDSDFYVYDLHIGYINIENLGLEPCESTASDDGGNEQCTNYYYLPCRAFKLESFLAYYNAQLAKKKTTKSNARLRKEMLAIFAVMCGNDYVDRSQELFTSLLATFDSSNNNNARAVRGSVGARRQLTHKKETLYDRMLQWLAQFDSADECVETMLRFVKKDKHATIRRVVHESVSDYMCLRPASLSLPSTSTVDTHATLISLPMFSGALMNEKLARLFRSCKLSRIGLDVLIHRSVVFRCQLECVVLPSAWLSSSRLRKFFYTLLMRIGGEQLPTESGNSDIVITEYLRYQNELKTYAVHIDAQFALVTLASLSNSSGDFMLATLFNLPTETCKRLGTLPTRLSYFFALIHFWLGSTQLTCCSKSNMVSALVLSFVKLSIIDSPLLATDAASQPALQVVVDTTKYQPTSDVPVLELFGSAIEGERAMSKAQALFASAQSNLEHVKAVGKKLAAFCSPIQLSDHMLVNKTSCANKAQRLLNLGIVHSLCEFQAIYLSMDYVREAMSAWLAIEDARHTTAEAAIVELLDAELFFNGQFIHNFVQELERRPNPTLFVEELLGRQSLLRHVFVELVSLYNSVFQ